MPALHRSLNGKIIRLRAASILVFLHPTSRAGHHVSHHTTDSECRPPRGATGEPPADSQADLSPTKSTDKDDILHDEAVLAKGHADHGHNKNAALEALGEGERIVMTDEDSRRICRKIDKGIMPVLMW